MSLSDIGSDTLILTVTCHLMKKTLFTAVLAAFLVGTVAPAFAQTAPVQGDTTKVKANGKKEKLKTTDGKAKINNKKGKAKVKAEKGS